MCHKKVEKHVASPSPVTTVLQPSRKESIMNKINKSMLAILNITAKVVAPYVRVRTAIEARVYDAIGWNNVAHLARVGAEGWKLAAREGWAAVYDPTGPHARRVACALIEYLGGVEDGLFNTTDFLGGIAHLIGNSRRDLQKRFPIVPTEEPVRVVSRQSLRSLN